MLDIKHMRKAAGLAQKQLADMVYIDKTTLCKYEKGERGIPVSVAKRLGKALNFDWWKLYEED